MNRRKEHHATIVHFRIEIAGQPTVVRSKCDELVSPPEQLAEHLPRCSTDRRLSVLKRGPLYKTPGDHPVRRGKLQRRLSAKSGGALFFPESESLHNFILEPADSAPAVASTDSVAPLAVAV